MILALIPARGGSKRIPNKNIKELGGKPLIAWSIATAEACNLVPHVSSDSELILDIAQKYDAAVITRPAHLASDDALDIDVISHALTSLPAWNVDLVVYLRPTTPLRSTRRVQDAIKIMYEAKPDSLRSVELMPESAFKNFRMGAGNVLKPLTKKDHTDRPNHQLPETFRPNGYVDIVRPENVMAGNMWGRSRYGFVTPPTVELDTSDQWNYAEYMAERRRPPDWRTPITQTRRI